MNRLLATLLVLALAMPVGCAPRPAPEPTPEPTPTTEPTPTPEPTPTVQAKLYFVRGEKIGAAGRDIETAEKIASRAFFAVQALVDGPTAEEDGYGLETAIPEGTRVNGVEVEDDGMTTVDLSKEFESGGGSLSMQLRVAQVVYTLTQFREVERVGFKIDGREVEAIGGEGVSVDPPLNRQDLENVTPAILVESPVPGETISSPLMASGTSNVFEATHQIEIKNPDGTVIAETFVTATSGTGTRGTWSQEVEFDSPTAGIGTFTVFEISAEDGSRINEVTIPVRFE